MMDCVESLVMLYGDVSSLLGESVAVGLLMITVCFLERKTFCIVALEGKLSLQLIWLFLCLWFGNEAKFRLFSFHLRRGPFALCSYFGGDVRFIEVG